MSSDSRVPESPLGGCSLAELPQEGEFLGAFAKVRFPGGIVVDATSANAGRCCERHIEVRILRTSAGDEFYSEWEQNLVNHRWYCLCFAYLSPSGRLRVDPSLFKCEDETEILVDLGYY